MDDGRVWRDTSAEDNFQSYLEQPQSHHYRGSLGSAAMTGSMAPRTTTAGNAHPDITVGLLDDDPKGKKKRFSGRRNVLPGAFVLMFVTACALGAITYFGLQAHTRAQKDMEKMVKAGIGPGGRPMPPKPAKPPKICRLPNYMAADGKIFASVGGKNSEFHIAGVNWSGMENGEGIPHGLAFGMSNIEDIAKQLVKNKFNAVRLPLNAMMILDDTMAPNTNGFVNINTNPGFNVATYMEMITQVVQGLGRERIAVMLDIHKLDPAYSGGASEKSWFTNKFTEADLNSAFQRLAKRLCNHRHYNIIGIDIKNEPIDGCWPAEDADPSCAAANNWPRAVERFGDAIHKICPEWLIVAEGLFSSGNKMTVNGLNVTYDDWYGASLQNALKNPIKLKQKNKLVFAPHFYSPSVYPTDYFFAAPVSLKTQTYPEYPRSPDGNTALMNAVGQVMDNAFGFIANSDSGVPIVYGEFGGIYGEAEDLKDKTSSRTIDFMMQYAKDKKFAGGFVWALNYDQVFNFNAKYVDPDSNEKPFQFGLYENDNYEKYRPDFAKALLNLEGNGLLPCEEVSKAELDKERKAQENEEETAIDNNSERNRTVRS